MQDFRAISSALTGRGLRNNNSGNPFSPIVAAVGTILLALAFIVIAPLTAFAEPEGEEAVEPTEATTTPYMGYTYVNPADQVPTLHINESSVGIAPSVDNLVYCFNSQRSWPPVGGSADIWHRKYNTTLSQFASAKPADQNVLNVMYSGFSSNPNRNSNRAKLGLLNDAEFYAATQMAIWRLTDGDFSVNTAWESIFGADRMKAIRAAAVKLVSSGEVAPSEATLEIYEAQNSNYQNLLGIHFVQKDSGDKFHGSISGSIENLKGESGESSGSVETTEEATTTTENNVVETSEATSVETTHGSASSETTESVEKVVRTEDKKEEKTKQSSKTSESQKTEEAKKTTESKKTTEKATKTTEKSKESKKAEEPKKTTEKTSKVAKPTTSKATEPKKTTEKSSHAEKTEKASKSEKASASKAASTSSSKTSAAATTTASTSSSKAAPAGSTNSHSSAPSKSSSSGALAQTGAAVWGLVGFAVVAIAVGLLMAWKAKRNKADA